MAGQILNNPGEITVSTSGIALGPTLTGGLLAADADDDGPFLQHNTPPQADSGAGLITPLNVVRPRWDVTSTFLIRPMGLSMTNLRVWVGLVSKGIPDNSGTVPSGTLCAAFNAEVSASQNWRAVVADAASSSPFNDTGKLFDVTTGPVPFWDMKIEVTSSQVKFFIDDPVTPVSMISSPTLPADTELGFFVRVVPTASETKHIRWQSISWTP